MKESRQELIERLCAAVAAYESYACENRAQWKIARQAFDESQKLFKALNIPDCSHNRAVAGATRYKKYMFRHYPHFLAAHQLEDLEEQRNRGDVPILDYEMQHGELRPRWDLDNF
jgi:hypothetical protein